MEVFRVVRERFLENVDEGNGRHMMVLWEIVCDKADYFIHFLMTYNVTEIGI